MHASSTRAGIRETVGEVLSASELLLETGETTAERMPARVDDACIGQNQVNQADVPAIVRHLVDEERGAGLAQRARVLQIPLTERAQFLGCELLDHSGEVLLPGVASGELTSKLRNLRQLHRSLDQGVTRQHLLQQGRACARQSDDEYRVRCQSSCPAARGKKIPGQYLPGPLHVGQVVVGPVGVRAPADLIAARVVAEGGLILGGVLEGFAERKLEVEALLIRKISPR